MLFSGSSCWSRKAWVLHSHPDTLRDMSGNHTRQLILKTRLRELLSHTCNGLGDGEARTSLEKSLDLSLM